MWLVDIMYSLCLGIGALNVIGAMNSRQYCAIAQGIMINSSSMISRNIYRVKLNPGVYCDVDDYNARSV